MTPIDPPSEGQAPRAASAGLVQPPPGLLDKVAERVRDELKRRTFPPDPITGLGGMGLTEHDIARAAWDAVAEGLGLERRYALREDDGTIWLNDHDTGEPLDSPDREWVESIRGGEELVTRLVSKWEPQP